jgi:hypothetical protein
MVRIPPKKEHTMSIARHPRDFQVGDYVKISRTNAIGYYRDHGPRDFAMGERGVIIDAGEGEFTGTYVIRFDSDGSEWCVVSSNFSRVD